MRPPAPQLPAPQRLAPQLLARLAATRQAVVGYGAIDPAGWDTGLSPAGARAALRAAVTEVLRADLRLPGVRAPGTLVIWCAANVFTAPLEWTALFAAQGSRVVLKAPSACPAPALALARAFAELGVEAHNLPHDQAWGLVEGADAVLGFGPDAAMAALEAHLRPEQRRSLHGHRVSVVLVRGHSLALARALAEDAALYDGRGCLSPAAVFCLGDAEALCANLRVALAEQEARWPRGELSPAEGAALRARLGLGRVQGRAWAEPGWALTCTPVGTARPVPLPRLLSVHPVSATQEAREALAGWPLSTLCTDLPADEARTLPGFWRLCRPGFMQRPPLGRPHDGQPVAQLLCTVLSEEL